MEQRYGVYFTIPSLILWAINFVIRKILKNYLLTWKVDISTMLEEAVQYVKFLQIQIKVAY